MKTKVAQTVTFGRAGDAHTYEGFGWWPGEEGFAWTSGAESCLQIPSPDAPFGFFIEVNLDPFIFKPRVLAQRLKIFVGCHIIADLMLTAGGYFAFLVSLPSKSGDLVELIFRQANALSAEAGGRQVAFAFRSIRIFPLEERPRSSLKRPRSTSLELGDSDPIERVASACGVPIREVLTSFEMLSGNCEFGGIQRRCGIEPLSLLRFAGASPAAAILGLDTLFDGLGERIEPWIVDNHMREWMIRDTRFNLNYHTMTSSTAVSRERVTALEKKKVLFLREKFFDDLATGEKIFLYVDRLEASEPQAVALFLALRRRSASQMLWIQAAPHAEMVGNLEFILPGLARGYIDRFAHTDDGTNVSLSGWLTILANAWLLLKRPLENARER